MGRERGNGGLIDTDVQTLVINPQTLDTLYAGTGGGAFKIQQVLAQQGIVDFDGDGKTDLVIYRKINGVWWIISSLGGSPISTGWGGDPSDMPVVGDWNGSGTTKIGVFQKATGTWYLDLNGNGLWDGCGTDDCIGWGGDRKQ
jgi:hypothetical protein